MPIKDQTIFCINHPNKPMIRNSELNALVQLSKQGDNVTFQIGSGLPTVAYFCETCGYLELYAAMKTPFWK